MFSKLVLFTFGESRLGAFRLPTPILNTRALEDIWLLADGSPAATASEASAGRAQGVAALLGRWRKLVTDHPIAVRDAIYSP